MSVERLLVGTPRPRFVQELGAQIGATSATMAPTIAVDASRVGVIADTHCAAIGGMDLPDAVLVALRDCDLVLHCGDLSTTDVLDRLGAVVPVLAVRSAADPPADGVRLFDGPLLVRAGSTLLGAIADLPDVDDPATVFGTDVDVVASGTTHVPLVRRAGPTLLVNPGSPTLPATGHPTVAILDLAGAQTTVNLVHLPRRSR